MIALFFLFLTLSVSPFKSKSRLEAENAAKVAAGLSISGVFELAPLRDSPQVNDKLKLTEVEVETLSPMRRPASTRRSPLRMVRVSCRR
jgi:hypothetical protein